MLRHVVIAMLLLVTALAVAAPATASHDYQCVGEEGVAGACYARTLYVPDCWVKFWLGPFIDDEICVR